MTKKYQGEIMNIKMKTAFSVILGGAIAFFGMTAAPKKSEAGTHGESETVLAGNIHVGKAERVEGSVVAKGGSVVIDGDVYGDCVAVGGAVSINGRCRGDVVSIGGGVSVSGRVDGDISALGGDVVLLPTAVVEGDVSVLGGRVKKSDGAVVRGDISGFGMSLRFLPRLVGLANYGKSGSAFFSLIGYALFLSFIAGVGILVLLLAAFLSRPLDVVAVAIKSEFWKSAGIGVLMIMGISPFFFLMAISILGIPFIPLAIMLLIAASLMGLASFGMILADKFLDGARRSVQSVLGRAALGYLLLTGLLVFGKLMEMAGYPLSLLGGIFIFLSFILISFGVMVGLGAIWITRMGSRNQSSAAPVA